MQKSPRYINKCLSHQDRGWGSNILWQRRLAPQWKYCHHPGQLRVSVDGTFYILILKFMNPSSLMTFALLTTRTLGLFTPLATLWALSSPRSPILSDKIPFSKHCHLFCNSAFLLCLPILPSSCHHTLLNHGGKKSNFLWTGARVSSFNPLTSGFSLYYINEAALSLSMSLETSVLLH